MKEAASKALEIPEELIFCRERKRRRGGTAGAAPCGGSGGRGAGRIVREGDLLYKVNLSGYLDTGLFLDRRKLRLLVRERAAGRRVLNLFS
jgi:23S rRNA G2069 N7-methylase RlmK/C1962 C5-methylase RlmI